MREQRVGISRPAVATLERRLDIDAIEPGQCAPRVGRIAVEQRRLGWGRGLRRGESRCHPGRLGPFGVRQRTPQVTERLQLREHARVGSIRLNLRQQRRRPSGEVVHLAFSLGVSQDG